METRKIVLNRIKTPDGTVLTSHYRHDYVSHLDANGETYVTDGGTDYLHRTLNKIPAEDLTIYDDAPFEVIRESFYRGSRGLDGKEVLKYIKLKDIDKGYLKAIIKYEEELRPNNIFLPYYRQELHIRKRFTPSVYGVGFLGYGKNKSSINKIAQKKYSVWKGLIRRCYSKEARDSTYKDCSVCTEWHNFQNFAEWYDENYIDEWHIDKDILVKGNKIYSPETCCFVPTQINTLFVTNTTARRRSTIGVRKYYSKYTSRVKDSSNESKEIYLGIFDTLEEAFEAYKVSKECIIKKIANDWKDKITERVYTAMYNYQVEITD